MCRLAFSPVPVGVLSPQYYHGFIRDSLVTAYTLWQSAIIHDETTYVNSFLEQFSNQYGRTFGFFESRLDLIAELRIPGSFRTEPALFQEREQQRLVFGIEQIQVNH